MFSLYFERLQLPCEREEGVRVALTTTMEVVEESTVNWALWCDFTTVI